ncbi:g9807 [Coccomyxa elongata]
MCDAVKQVTIPLLGARGQQLSIWLFRNVRNAKAIQQQLVAGSLEPELAFINANLVPDLLVVQAAAQKALAAHLRGSLRTRSLHAELVYNLSGSKHVGQSLQRFGLSEDTDQILVASFHMDDTDAAKVLSIVEGEPADLHTLSSLTDLATVKKVYKIVPPELDVGTLADAICCRIAASHC